MVIYDSVLREAVEVGLIADNSLMRKAELLVLMFEDQEVYSEWVVFPAHLQNDEDNERKNAWISFWKRSVIDKFFTVEIL